MAKKITLEEFTDRCVTIHGNLYNYSNNKNINFRIKLNIFCKKHNTFFKILPQKHLYGQISCKECIKEKIHKSKSYTTEEFIQKAKKINNNINIIDYSHVIYINSTTKVKLFCNICKNYFFQTPNGHLSGRGCTFCKTKYKLTKEEFIEKAIKIHKNLYSYDYIIYINMKSYIKIKCNTCNLFFEQIAGNHLSGSGCSNCFGVSIMNTKKFIEKSKKIHGDTKFCYDESIYINAKTKLILFCNDCNFRFEQVPYAHYVATGCPKCSCRSSKKENEWLDSINISKNIRNICIKINNKQYKFDALDNENKIVYEFYGSY